MRGVYLELRLLATFLKKEKHLTAYQRIRLRDRISCLRETVFNIVQNLPLDQVIHQYDIRTDYVLGFPDVECAVIYNDFNEEFIKGVLNKKFIIYKGFFWVRGNENLLPSRDLFEKYGKLIIGGTLAL